MDATLPTADLTFGERLRGIVGGSVGNLIEWYDFYIYAFFAPYFAGVFFPKSDAASQLINTFLLYALGFAIRPVGGWLLGRYADRAGRRAALSLSVSLMCVGSLLIGVLPTYATLGIAAPIVLGLARLLQGISLGGEYGTSATYLSEIAGARHRGFWSSFQYVTLIGGQVTASALLLLVQLWFSDEELHSFAWRIPFLIGAVFSVYGLYLRQGLAETTEFARVADRAGRGNTAALLRHWREVLLVFGLTAGGTTAFYTYTVYMAQFLTGTVGLAKSDATQISLISLVLYAAMQPLFGYASDRVGRRAVLLFFGVFGTLFTVPILSALAATHDYATALALVMAALFIVSGYTSINAVVKAELFPAEIRALGVGLPYAVAVSLFGGTAPLIALQLKDLGHEAWFYWYVTVLIAISLLVYATMRDTRAASRITA